ncbi:MAG: hypothetical protein ACM3TU_01550 [Bacillota bacterium]
MRRLMFALGLLASACSPAVQEPRNAGFERVTVDYSHELSQFYDPTDGYPQPLPAIAKALRGFRHRKPQQHWVGVVPEYEASDYLSKGHLREATAHEMLAADEQTDLLYNKNYVCARGTPVPNGFFDADYKPDGVHWDYPQISRGPQYFGEHVGRGPRYGRGDRSCRWVVLVER